MRLWTLHPKYLDSRGLVALWREALLAQAVLRGETRGYRHHPQLTRFREQPRPKASIAAYLSEVHAEAERRGYAFDESKIRGARSTMTIATTRGQLAYEWTHLTRKLRQRQPAWLRRIRPTSEPNAHPIFQVKPGPVESWETVAPAVRRTAR
jgi:hypothetical protein